MKNKTLLFSLFTLLFLSKANSQIVNSSFENWQQDTTNFSGYPPVLSADTFYSQDPVSWTTSNSITALPAFGGSSLVTQSDNYYSGLSATQLKTDTIYVPKFGGGTTPYNIPGFMLNGHFTIDVASLVAGANITPSSVNGAGMPFTQRLQAFKGYYNYAPVFNPNTNSNDTCLIWATLKGNGHVLADAIFKSTVATNGYVSFSQDFVYSTSFCEAPDTIIVLVASSIPNIPSLVSGHSNVVSGSVLLVDDLSYDTLTPANYPAPIAVADADTTIKNTAKNIYVKTNDIDCINGTDGLILYVAASAFHGTAVADQSNSFISYTPNQDFVGTDSFAYVLDDGTNTSFPATVTILVQDMTGIANVNKLSVSLYPVPVNNELNIQFENPGKTTAKVYNMVGQQVYTMALNQNFNALSTSALSNGCYLLQIVDEKNQSLASSRFTVVR